MGQRWLYPTQQLASSSDMSLKNIPVVEEVAGAVRVDFDSHLRELM